MMTDWSRYWWESITGPRNLTMAVSQSLREKGTVCLIVPDDLPWRSEMRAYVEYDLRQSPEMEAFDVDFIDISDECSDIDDIGRYLLTRYATPSVASGFRKREKIQQYISNNHVLENRVLWVKGMNHEQEQKCIQFCRDYYPATETNGRFVLEIHSATRENDRKNLGVIHYEEMVNNHDLSLFNSIYLNQAGRRYASIWQQYSATLCATLCGTDAETSLALMETTNFTAQEPMSGLLVVANDGQYQRRGVKNENHILSAVRNDDHAVIEALVWKSQLQVLFPLVEMERVSFIERYHAQIEEAMRENYVDYSSGRTHRIKQFGEYIDDPADAELGTIHRMTKLRRDSDNSQYLLYLPDESTRTRVELLHELRNYLAHGKVCSVGQVAEFINAHPFRW